MSRRSVGLGAIFSAYGDSSSESDSDSHDSQKVTAKNGLNGSASASVSVVVKLEPGTEGTPPPETELNPEIVSSNAAGISEDNAISKESVEEVEGNVAMDLSAVDQIEDEDEAYMSFENFTRGKDDVQKYSKDGKKGELYSGTAYQKVQIKEEVETEDSASDSESTISDELDDDEALKKAGPPRVKGEMTFKDLPPIEDLHISVPRDQCKPVGTVKSFVDPLVVVEAYLHTPALDIDSVLFLDEGDRALGKIYDVIGPVKQPFYCVRFNSLDHMQQHKIEPGMVVYCAPSTPHTSYVFLAQLKQMKGTDASWLDDIEPPPEEQYFSDDDAEQAAKKKGRKKLRGKRNRGNPNEPGSENGENSQPQPRSTFIPPKVPGFWAGYHGELYRATRPRARQQFQNGGYRPPRPSWNQPSFPPFPSPSHASFAPQQMYQPQYYQAPPPPPPPPRDVYDQQSSGYGPPTQHTYHNHNQPWRPPAPPQPSQMREGYYTSEYMASVYGAPDPPPPPPQQGQQQHQTRATEPLPPPPPPGT